MSSNTESASSESSIIKFQEELPKEIIKNPLKFKTGQNG